MLAQWNPFEELGRLQEQLWRSFASTDGQVPAFRPAVDVWEDDEAIVVQAELPGVRREDVRLDVEDGVLTLRGELRPDSEQRSRRRYHMLERRHGRFQRAFVLPDAVDTERIEAELRDGVLTVRLPKREQNRPRRIEVKGG